MFGQLGGAGRQNRSEELIHDSFPGMGQVTPSHLAGGFPSATPVPSAPSSIDKPMLGAQANG